MVWIRKKGCGFCQFVATSQWHSSGLPVIIPRSRRTKAEHMKIEMSLFTVTFLQSTKTMELRSCDKKMFRVPQLVEIFL